MILTFYIEFIYTRNIGIKPKCHYSNVQFSKGNGQETLSILLRKFFSVVNNSTVIETWLANKVIDEIQKKPFKFFLFIITFCLWLNCQKT